MSLTASLALIGFVPLSLALFALIPARRAVLSCYIAGWLFLPNMGFHFPGLPDYNKQAAIALGTILGVLIFDVGRLSQFRPSIMDLPMGVFCLWPMFSHLHQGHDPLTGLNWVISHLNLWGIPYLIGRLYFCDQEGLRELAIGVFVGGLVYLPFCWLEVRISPKLSGMLYGQAQGLGQHIRYGGYRPLLFMQHSLMVALWMASSTVVGFWLWRCKTIRRIGTIPMKFLVPFMFFTTIFACKSGNAVFALALGVIAFVVGSKFKSPVLILILALVPPTYILVRSTGIWSGKNVLDLIAAFDEERMGSLRVRMYQEDVYTNNARRQFLFGWAGPGMIPKDENGKNLTRGNDSFWIITFSMYGVVSLVSIFAVLAAAPTAWVLAQDARFPTPLSGPGAGLALMVVIFAIDCLANGMIIPIFLLAAGALIRTKPIGKPSQELVYEFTR